MRQLVYIALIVVIMVSVACNRVPKAVIQPDDMSELLADLHVAEVVVDQNHGIYREDSTRILLRQSVFAKHGVTAADFDTSLVWYGHNLDKYLEVYDDAISILEKRNRALGTAIVQSAVSLAGDSVDIWPGTRYVRLSNLLPSHFITFNIPHDENWEVGDVYTWRLKLVDQGIRSVRWNVLAEYEDSTFDWLSSMTSTRGWNEIIFATDSTRSMTNMRGFIEFVIDDTMDEKTAAKQNLKSREYWVDSISLIRKRINPALYTQRYRIRNYRKL